MAQNSQKIVQNGPKMTQIDPNVIKGFHFQGGKNTSPQSRLPCFKTPISYMSKDHLLILSKPLIS